jgi:hypothetical protein
MFARLELKLQAIPVSSLKGLEVFNQKDTISPFRDDRVIGVRVKLILNLYTLIN